MTGRAVFVSPQLNEFITKPSINNYLETKGLKILNYDEFMLWYKNINSSIIPSENDIVEGLIDMAVLVCKNFIHEPYARIAINNLISNPDKFDFMAAVTSNYNEPITSIEEIKTVRNNKILSYIIIEKGECGMRQEEYAVNLICSRTVKIETTSGKTDINCKGSVLLAAYLYCLKKIGKSIGILELAGGYNNIQGFYSYSRLGFEKDMSLYNTLCFNGINNLPMSVNLNEDYTEEQIVSNALTTDRYNDVIKRDTTGFLILKPIIEKLIKIGTTVATTIAESEPSYKYKSKYDNIYNKVTNNITFLSLISNLMYKLEGVENISSSLSYTGNPITQLKANLIDAEHGSYDENTLLSIIDKTNTTDKNELNTLFKNYQGKLLNNIENDMLIPSDIKTQVNKFIEDVNSGIPIDEPIITSITQELLNTARTSQAETTIMEKQKIRSGEKIRANKKSPGCEGSKCNILGGKHKKRTRKYNKRTRKYNKRTRNKKRRNI